MAKLLTIGIDAANLRRGGGVTHLVELLRFSQPADFGVGRVIVWAGRSTLDALEERPWLDKRNPPVLDKPLFWRSLWQRYRLSQAARDLGCDLLFVPGGNFEGTFRPIVTMSRNMLPFEWVELRRYGWSAMAVKLVILRLMQSRSFRKADGIIFLTDFSRRTVLEVTGPLQAKISTVPHGLNPRFRHLPKPQLPIERYSNENPYRILYVSIVDQYKHQWVAVEAVSALRRDGFPVVLDLIGPAYPPALKRLNTAIDRFGEDNSWVRYHGSIPFDDLHIRYAQADLGLFASSCENMPNILLEAMASGLPVACSDRGPMPEVLGAGGSYFDPERSADMARALKELIASPRLRSERAKVSYQRAMLYSWERCAEETFRFLTSIVRAPTSHARSSDMSLPV